MNKIQQTDNYTLRARIKHLDCLEDHFLLQFTSQLAGSRFPDEERTLTDFTLSRAEMVKLSSVINLGLAYSNNIGTPS
jgi:hypothetical protein